MELPISYAGYTDTNDTAGNGDDIPLRSVVDVSLDQRHGNGLPWCAPQNLIQMLYGSQPTGLVNET